MTETCPSDDELERLLADQLGRGETQARKRHVQACAACRLRLEQLNRGKRILPPTVPLEQTEALVPSPGPPPAQPNALEWDIEEDWKPTREASSADAAAPIAERPEDTPASPAGSPEGPRSELLETMGYTSDSAAAAENQPTAFGRYQVRRALGTGGFGTVYLGHDTQLNRPVAIKVRRGQSGRSQAEGEQVLQEARRLARLRHPGIVAVHDVGIHEGQVYIVSDYLDGPDLDRWLADNRPTWQEAVRITAAVADALAHAHARLIVHRDVKPANILLTAERTPVLVDFGLALDETQASGPPKGTVTGTPWYMSPEQVVGAVHRLDGRSDVYSLGVVLYEMLSGRLPFRGLDSREVLRQVRDDQPPPPRQFAPDIPPELERACLQAMAKRRQDRYSTAAEFADDLRRILQLTAPAPAPAPASAVQQASLRYDPQTASSSRRTVREAERRQVTVLVCGCDLFESEAYLQALDVEDQAKVLRAFQQTCAQAVGRLDGTMVQCNEHGLLACFGFPVAFEDAARRAARTGLDLLADMKALAERFRREHRLELNPWVGIHTGPAVVEADETKVTLVGEARNVAVRLQDAVAPGQVICTEPTHRLIRSQFQCINLGPQKVRGVAQPVELFGVQGVGAARSPIEAAGPAGLTPLTGRDHEISLLKERWEQAQEGTGQVVLLIGEPGLGKSRLVYTLKEHVLGRMAEGDVDAPVIEWRCSPHFQNTGLYPAIDFYERALGFGRQEPPQARFDHLLHRLEQHDLARPQTVPLWAALLSLPIPAHYPPLALSPVRQREETFRALLEWLHTQAARRPILFIIEDLHWADASTLEFLGQYLAEGSHHTILTLLTFRPEFRTPWPARAHQTSLALTRLTRRQVGDLMRRKTGGALPEALVEQVYDRTGGVPLFVEEFTKMLQESGALDQVREGGTEPRGLMARAIPATLQDLVMARVDRMEGDRELAQLAATLGREFSYEQLAAVATLDEPTLQAELARLVRAEILYPKGRPPRCGYIFKHALLEDALYNALVKDRRQQFHRRIAQALEAQFPQTVATQPELLAYHCSEGSLPEKAVGYWLQAGRRSQQRSANEEAIGHFTKGRELLATLEDSPERAALELQLLNPLGTAYIAARGYAAPEVGPVFRQARELCERIGEPSQRFGILWGAWVWHLTRGELRRSLELAGEAVALAEQVNEPGMVMEAVFLPAVTLVFRGEFGPAHAHCARALAEYDDRARTRFWAGITGEDSGVAHRCYLSVALWHLGYPDQALKVNQEAIELARAIGHLFTMTFALEHRAWLCIQCRLAAEAREAVGEEITLATEQGFAYWLASATLFKADALVLEGQGREALPLLLEGLQKLRGTGTGLNFTLHRGFLGAAYTQAGRFDDATKALDEGLAIADLNDERFYEAELHRLKGEVLAESADPLAAEACFRQAIETARRQQSKGWELRATTSLARLWQGQGRRDEARAALAAIHSRYTEGFATPDLVEASALLDSLA